VKTDFGYHLIKVDKLGANATAADLEDINSSDAMRAKINKQLSAWIGEIGTKATIENYLALPDKKQE
ncbi:MAG: foldase, partial [Abditibacteriota bacterium]|nr:foldase [Abditibacteriota bacterium]